MPHSCQGRRSREFIHGLFHCTPLQASSFRLEGRAVTVNLFSALKWASRLTKNNEKECISNLAAPRPPTRNEKQRLVQMTMMKRRLLLHSLLLLVPRTSLVSAGTSETCKADQDGTCNSNSSLEQGDHCIDTDGRCLFWKEHGECEANPGFMLQNCQKACNVCNTGRSIDALIEEARKKLDETKI